MAARCALSEIAQDHARSFFEFLWCNLAEPLAESEAAHEMEEEDYLMDSFHEHVLAAIPDDGAVEGLGVGTDREMRPGQCSELLSVASASLSSVKPGGFIR